MTAGRRYAGRGIGELRTARTLAVVEFSGPEEATLLPDPFAQYIDTLWEFVRATGALHGSTTEHPRPRLTARDVKVTANFVTLALRNDLPHIDPYDAAGIWEKWRQAVVDLRELLRNVGDDDQALIVGTVLDGRFYVIVQDLALALAEPRKVADRYCPWQAEFFSDDRVYPEMTR